jgi:CRP-like cAMP-binding protein
MAASALREVLGGVELFHGLSQRELGALARTGRTVDFAAGDTITEQGAAGDRFFVILEGEATVRINGRARKHLGPGGYIGEMALIDRAPRSATVVADTPVRTFSLASFAFRPLLRELPTLSEKLLLEMCRRLRENSGEQL